MPWAQGLQNAERQGHGQFESLSKIWLDPALLLEGSWRRGAKLRVRHSVMPQREQEVLIQFTQACPPLRAVVGVGLGGSQHELGLGIGHWIGLFPAGRNEVSTGRKAVGPCQGPRPRLVGMRSNIIGTRKRDLGDGTVLKVRP